MKLPRLTLRELFLLVVIAAMGCGWLVQNFRLIAQYEGRIRELNGVCDQLMQKWGEENADLRQQVSDLQRRLALLPLNSPMPTNPYEPPKEVGTPRAWRVPWLTIAFYVIGVPLSIFLALWAYMALRGLPD
jgi:hypothetical protein